MKYYLVGIKGTGMSSLACYLYDMENEVCGSDVGEFQFNDELYKRKIKIYEFNQAELTNDYIYIIGNAYDKDFSEVKEIIKKRFKYYYYHEFISQIKTFSIAVSGTHGKTTTTKFLVDLLSDQPISYIIGDGTGRGNKENIYFIYEACEYKDHFLSYKPDILLITSIDYDHPDYYQNIEHIRSSFSKAMSNANKVIRLVENEYQILNQTKNGFNVLFNDETYIFPLPGIKYLEDYLLCVKTLKYLGYSYEYIHQNTKNIKLPKRRTTETVINNTIIIEDFAHHPAEIKALYSFIKQKYPDYKTVCFFQPHTYTRTFSLYKEFIMSLRLFDETYIDKVYTSKREPYNLINEYKALLLFSMFKKYNNQNLSNINSEDKQIIILLGAGDLNQRFFN